MGCGSRRVGGVFLGRGDWCGVISRERLGVGVESGRHIWESARTRRAEGREGRKEMRAGNTDCEMFVLYWTRYGREIICLIDQYVCSA